MLIHELNPRECAEVLSRNHLGRLACARLDQPYIVPIHYSFDAEKTASTPFNSRAEGRVDA